MTNSLQKLSICNTGALTSAFFNPSNVSFLLDSHFHGYSFCNWLCSGAVIVAKCCTNLAWKLHRLKNICSSLIVVFAGYLAIALFFNGPIDMVKVFMIWPRYCSSARPNALFLHFALSLCSYSLLRTHIKYFVWSCSFF